MIWILLSALSGGAWRRWDGAAVTGFLGHRWLKLIIAFLLGSIISLYWTDSFLISGIVGLSLMGGWTPPAQFGRIDNDFTWPLLARYGGVTAATALIVAVLTNDIGAMAYAPVGLFACLGYTVGKKFNPNGCWTCIGEAWLGAVIYGFLFLI